MSRNIQAIIIEMSLFVRKYETNQIGLKGLHTVE
jgi:hypothetical protein